jgi:ribosome-binding protein aMBF1 (putative translation factor)
MAKRRGEAYENFVAQTNEIAEVREYLTSLPVILGDLVLARRQQLKWTQKDLATKAQTTQARISQIEDGFAGTKMETMARVFDALGLVSINPGYRDNAAAHELNRMVAF